MNRHLHLMRLSLAVFLVFAITNTVQAKKPEPPNVPPGQLTELEQLGKLLFEDASLSNPVGQSCQTCHQPDHGFADPNGLPVSEGANSTADQPVFGTRNAPSAGYAAFTPDFTEKRSVMGGQFWDGRVADLEAQAEGPFLSPLEMNNTTEEEVIEKIWLSETTWGENADLFTKVCEPDSDTIEELYECAAGAIAAFERTEEFSPFSSKYDAVQAGLAELTAEEQNGQALFNGNAKCGHCHTAKTGGNAPVLFTDFKYHNLGLPRNLVIDDLWDQPLPTTDVPDLGLGGFTNDPREYGKFKDPHLRNIELTSPYMHNGVLLTLKQVVHFYNTRDVLDFCEDTVTNLDAAFGDTCWPAPEIPETMDSSFLGNLNLTGNEEDDIVAFLCTLTDGYDIDNGYNGMDRSEDCQ